MRNSGTGGFQSHDHATESSDAFLFQRKVRPDESGREYFERYLRKETGDG